MRTTGVSRETKAERHALWSSIIRKAYDMIVKKDEKERHVLGRSKPDVFRFAVACH